MDICGNSLEEHWITPLHLCGSLHAAYRMIFSRTVSLLLPRFCRFTSQFHTFSSGFLHSFLAGSAGVFITLYAGRTRRNCAVYGVQRFVSRVVSVRSALPPDNPGFCAAFSPSRTHLSFVFVLGSVRFLSHLWILVHNASFGSFLRSRLHITLILVQFMRLMPVLCVLSCPSICWVS